MIALSRLSSVAKRPIVFFHAHPDDEAIFTGGTAALLASDRDAVVVLATSGEAGLAPAEGDEPTGAHRRTEAERAAHALGADLEFLDYADSGMHGEIPHGFVHQPRRTAAERLAKILRRRGAGALVIYDEFGIYGHPDHLAAHDVGQMAAEIAGVPTVYECTVDREYLHFVETHLVVSAGVPEREPGTALAATTLGMPTVLIDYAIDVRRVLDTKREAMAAHASQIPPDGETMRLDNEVFSAVYGWEWYCRHGAPGPIEELR